MLYKLGQWEKLNIIKGNSHGTDMFSTQPELMDEIAGWAVQRMK